MNKIVKNFIVNGMSSILGQLVAFITMTYYASLVGKDLFGSITLAQQVLLYFSMTVLFGLQTLGMRIVSKNTEKLEEIVSEIIGFRLLVAFICFIIVVGICFYQNKLQSFSRLLFIFSITLFPIAMNLDWLFNGLQDMQHNAVFNLCKNIIPGIIILIFLHSDKDIYIVPIATLAGIVVGIAYQYIILAMKYEIRFRLCVKKSYLDKYTKLGFPFLISGLLSMVNNNVDKIVMGFSRSEGELGIYQAAYAFISFLITVESLIFIPLFPLLSEYYNNKELDKLKDLTQNIVKLISVIIIPIVALGLILSKDIIRLFYRSEEYTNAYIPFNILLIYILILYFREIYGYGLNAWEQEKKYLNAVMASAILNALLCILIVPRYGYISAAIITTVTELVNFYIMRSYSNRIVKIIILKDSFKVLAPAAVMSIITYSLSFVRVNLLINLTVSLILYAVCLLLFKILDLKELKSFILRR